MHRKWFVDAELINTLINSQWRPWWHFHKRGTAGTKYLTLARLFWQNKKFSRQLLNHTFKFQFQQNTWKLSRFHGDFSNQLVNVDRIGFQRVINLGLLSTEGWQVFIGFRRRGNSWMLILFEKWGQLFNNILDMFYKFGPLLYECMSAGAFKWLNAAPLSMEIEAILGWIKAAFINFLPQK